MKISTIHKLKMPFEKKIIGLNWVLNRFLEKAEMRLLNRHVVVGCIKNTKNNIVVSLTTYPARNQKVIYTIKSLLNQDMKIDRLIVWLSKEQYQGQLPKEFILLKDYGVEFKFCDDLKSHKKYYYAMQEFKDSIIITVDDDVIYPENTVSKLVKAHVDYPNTVICNQARLITFDEQGRLLPYKAWKKEIPYSARPNFAVLPIGEGGVLYPPKVFGDREAFQVDKIMSCARNTDDLWLKVMAVRNNVGAMITTNRQRGLVPVKIKGEEKKGLNVINVSLGGNDRSINELKKMYPEVWDKIYKDFLKVKKNGKRTD